jgi:NitT/TauT family transport system ATP-binding protein
MKTTEGRPDILFWPADELHCETSMNLPEPIVLPAPADSSVRTTAPAITFDQVSHIFSSTQGQKVQALKELSFTVARHEFVSIVGPSGCGKSTVLRLIAGLIKPTHGKVMIYKNPVIEPPDGVGIVFQKPTLLPWLDVMNNVTFPMRHKHGEVHEAEKKQAIELLKLVGLSDFAKSRPDELSGGMQQRAAIARALLLDPEILLMDEPFSALDALSRDEMSLELLRIWVERPKTVIFITHSIPEAVLLSDRIIVMTPRPGAISEIITNPLPRPRGIDTLSDPIFHELSAHIRHTIFSRRTA